MVKSHSEMIKTLSEIKTPEADCRERSREQERMIYRRGGQWERQIWERLANRPRYQLDLISPIVRQIVGDISRSAFDIAVSPASNDASEETAQTYEGIIRHISNISNAKSIYRYAATGMVTCGISGWRVSNRALYGSFEDDIVLDHIDNFKDRVWFDPGSRLQTRADSEFCVVEIPMTLDNFNKRFPKSKGQQGIGESGNVKDGQIYIGEYLCKKYTPIEYVLLSNGIVVEVDENYMAVSDELMVSGIREIDRRTRNKITVYRRYFSGDDWLENESVTIFNQLPIIPLYGNYHIIDDEIGFYGEPEKLIDPQRVTNYTLSRLTEDTALRPKSKMLMTPEQAAGNTDSYRTMNVDNKPILTYNHVDGQPPPGYQTPAPPDPTLITIMQTTTDYINRISGMFSANMGDNPGLQSGVAIGQQINQGNNSSTHYFDSIEIAINHTAQIIVDAIPNIYNDRNAVRVLGENGAASYAKIKFPVFDQQTRQVIELNDLSKGKYSVSLSVGPGYQNKQQQTVDNIIEIAKVDPSILQIGSDVMLENISAPGVKQIAERKRFQMVQAGLIPQDQLSDDEKMMLQAQQQQGQQQISPMDQLAMATAQAEVKKAEAQTADIISKVHDRDAKNQLEAQKLALQANELAIKTQAEQQKIAMAQQQMTIDVSAKLDEHYKMLADTLKTIREAIGADAVMHPAAIQAYEKKAIELNK